MSENSPISFDHKVFWGEHKLLQFPVKNGEGQINAWNISWRLWPDENKEQELVIKDQLDGITVIDNAAGVCQVTLDTDDWALIDQGNSYYYELWRTDIGNEQALAFGEFYVR